MDTRFLLVIIALLLTSCAAPSTDYWGSLSQGLGTTIKKGK
jgi:hypothetical protein